MFGCDCYLSAHGYSRNGGSGSDSGRHGQGDRVDCVKPWIAHSMTASWRSTFDSGVHFLFSTVRYNNDD